MHQISKKKRGQIFISIFFLVCLIALDQITKQAAVLHLKNAPAVPLIPGIFEFSYLENHGAAFGILQGQNIFLILMTVIVLVVLIYLYLSIPEEKHFFFMRFILVLFVSGAIGNFIDRCLYDYVIDFFYFRLIDFPVFNVADIYVTVAAALLAIVFFFYYKEEDIDLILGKLLFFKKREKP